MALLEVNYSQVSHSTKLTHPFPEVNGAGSRLGKYPSTVPPSNL